MAKIVESKNTYHFPISGLSQFPDAVEQLKEHNSLYDLTQSQLEEQCLTGKPIYEHLYIAHKTELSSPEKNPEAIYEPAKKPEDEEQTEKPSVEGALQKGSNAGNRIAVYADGAQIGWIKPGYTEKVTAILNEEQIHHISLKLQGGAFKTLAAKEDDTFFLEHESVTLYGSITIESSPKKAGALEHAAAGSEVKSYIDTSYDLAERKEDKRKRGFISLLFTMMLTGFYLAFSIPYWYLIHQGREPVFTFISERITEQDVFYHLCAMIAALLVTLIAMAAKSRFWVFLALLLHAGAAGYLIYLTRDPWYAAPGALQTLLCLIALVRKRG